MRRARARVNADLSLLAAGLGAVAMAARPTMERREDKPPPTPEELAVALQAVRDRQAAEAKACQEQERRENRQLAILDYNSSLNNRRAKRRAARVAAKERMV